MGINKKVMRIMPLFLSLVLLFTSTVPVQASVSSRDKGLDLDSTAILLHGTSSVRHNMGINESVIYGDYYYMETLVRLLKPDWKRYW